MTEKMILETKVGKGDQLFNKNKDLGYRDYLIWKMKYEKEARRKYKWPILQVLLQTAIMKLVLYEKVPNHNLVQYAVQFLKISAATEDSVDFG